MLENVPRELYNGCIRLYDYLNAEKAEKAENEVLMLSVDLIKEFALRNKSKEGGLSPLHESYLSVLELANRPLGLNTIAVKMGLDEKTVEEDIEPLLIKLGYVERGQRGRVRLS